MASEGCQKILEAELLAHLRLEAEALGVLHRDFAVVVCHVVDDGHVLEEVDLPAVLVEASFELPVGAEHALGGLEDRLFDRLDQASLVDPLVLRDHLDGLKEGQIAGAGLLLLDCHVALSASSAGIFSSAMPSHRSSAMPSHRSSAMPSHRSSAILRIDAAGAELEYEACGLDARERYLVRTPAVDDAHAPVDDSVE